MGDAHAARQRRIPKRTGSKGTSMNIPAKYLSRKFLVTVAALVLGGAAVFTGADVAGYLKAIAFASAPIYVLIEGLLDRAWLNSSAPQPTPEELAGRFRVSGR
jgi:hypothetical protein